MRKVVKILLNTMYAIGIIAVFFTTVYWSNKYFKTKFYIDNERKNATALSLIKNLKLFPLAKAEGQEIFARRCEACHGPEGRGKENVPALKLIYPKKKDDLDQITNTIQSGYMSSDEVPMPDFKWLGYDQTFDVTDYVLSLSRKIENVAATERGKVVFTEHCIVCHGESGKGNQELKVTSLADESWLYGGTKDDIFKIIREGRLGPKHDWAGQLDDMTIKMLTVYLWSLNPK